VDEISAFEQERLTGRRGEGIGAAVAEVECSSMTSFAVAPVRVPRQLQLVHIERNDIDSAPMQKEIELATRRGSFSRFDDNARFQHGYGRHDARGVGVDGEGSLRYFRLPGQPRFSERSSHRRPAG
jgi:hypothetical protein